MSGYQYGDGHEENDSIKIATGVFESIAVTVSKQVPGVAQVQTGGFFGKKSLKVEIAEDGVSFEIPIVVNYGKQLHTVCREVQEKVKENVIAMTGMNVKAVNVNVESIHLPEEKGRSDVPQLK